MPTPGWVNSTRLATLPRDWKRRVAQVRARAAGRCEWPGFHGSRNLPIAGERCAEPGTDCDHIGDPMNHDLANLQWLCHPHHDKKTIDTRRTRRRSDRRPPERHPGLTGEKRKRYA